MSARPDSWMPLYWPDYWRDTGHLSGAQHGAYLNLIGRYWCSGRPLPDDDEQLWRLALCDSRKAWQGMRSIVLAFFRLECDGWRHKRIDAELTKAVEVYERRAKANRENIRKRYDKPTIRSEAVDDSNTQQQPQPHSEASASEVRRVAPAKPTKGSRLAADWELPEAWREWAEAERPDLDIARQAAMFRDYWTAKPGAGGVKLDWGATWRNWIRSAKPDGKPARTAKPNPLLDAFAERAHAARRAARNGHGGLDAAEPDHPGAEGFGDADVAVA